MEQIWKTIRTIFTAVGGLLGWLLGGTDGFLYVLIAFVCLDYTTGILAATVEQKLNSAVGFKGIARKVSLFALVALGHLIDQEILQNAAVLRTAVIFFYISNEGLSILENVTRIGLPVPEKLKSVLEHIKTKDGE